MNLRITFREYGGPGVLQVDDVPDEAPQAGQARVALRAIGVNPVDWKVIAGWGDALSAQEASVVPGRAGAGVVVALGEGVQGVTVGDEVLFTAGVGGEAIPAAGGTYQQRVDVAVDRLVPKPALIEFDQAAALPVSADTGYALVQNVKISADDTLLVHGAAGAVGSAAVQVAVGLGARVIATASMTNHDYLRGLGAIPVAYGEGLEDAVRAIGTVTAVVHAVGGEENVAATTALLGDLSRSATCVGDDYVRAAGIPFVQHPVDELQRTTELAASGKLTVRIAESLPLRKAATALEHSIAGHVRGKIILLP